MKYAWEELLEKFSVQYDNAALYEQAFTHPSFSNEMNQKRDLERLEFMGDAVCQLFVSELIYAAFPDVPEGQLTLLRSNLVSEKGMAKIAKQLNLGKYVYLGIGEEKNHGRERVSLLADLVESFIGALYLDTGIETTRKIVRSIFKPYLKNLSLEGLMDYKSKLQEYVQADSKRSVHYKVIESYGPDNDPTYVVEVYMDDLALGRGVGKSKKAAEKAAAKDALSKAGTFEDIKKEG